MRNTPWVEGCCGPIDTSINSPSSRAPIVVGGRSAGSSVWIVALIAVAPRYLPHRPIAGVKCNAVSLFPKRRHAASARTSNRLVRDNLCASDNPEIRPTSKCVADPGGRRSERHRDQKFSAPETQHFRKRE